FSSSENKLAAWVGVNKKDMYQVPLINYKILKSLGNSFFNEDVGRAFYLAEKKFCMQTETTILHSIKEVIRDNKKTELKFCIHRHDTKVAITLFSQNYVEERHKHVLNNICSFFDQESSLKNFKAIENKINNKKPAINEVIINKALKHNNFSVLVFLLHKFYSEIYQEGIHVIADMIGVGSILDTAIDDNKKLLIQAGYEVESLIRLLKQAASDNKVEKVKSLFTIVLESGNLNSCYGADVFSYICEFKLYDLIPKLFEERYFSPGCFDKQILDANKIHIMIKTCYDHYKEELWKDPRAQYFLDLALCSVEYDKKLLDYLASIIDTLPFPDYHKTLLDKVMDDRNNESFGKKMEFLFSKGIDIVFFKVPLLNYCTKDYLKSYLYRIVCSTSEDIIIKKIIEKQCVNQAIGVSFIQDLFRCAVIAQKWRIVGHLLPHVTFEYIKYMTYYDSQDSCIFFLDKLMKHCSDQMLESIKKYMQENDGPFFMTDYNCFVAKILSSAIDAKQLEIVKFLLLHDKVNLLNGYSVGLDIFNYLMDNALAEVIQNCKKWNDITSLLSYAKSCHLNKIVVYLQQSQLINIEQVFQWYEEGKFSNSRSEKIINAILNNQSINDDKAKKLLLDAINKKQWFYVE